MTHDIVQTSAEDTLPPFDPATFWAQFRHDAISIKGVRLHFVEGGSGAPIFLVPGWPHRWAHSPSAPTLRRSHEDRRRPSAFRSRRQAGRNPPSHAGRARSRAAPRR
jgi:hypothetical protein